MGLHFWRGVVIGLGLFSAVLGGALAYLFMR